jgi:hypothetical protein
LLAISKAVVVHRYDTVHIAWWRRFMAFLKATTHHHRASTHSDNINRTCLPMFLWYFIVKSSKKGSSWHLGP